MADDMTEFVEQQLRQADHIGHDGTGDAGTARLSCFRCGAPVTFGQGDGMEITLSCHCVPQPARYEIPRSQSASNSEGSG